MRTDKNTAMGREATTHGFVIVQRKPSTVEGCAVVCAFRGPSMIGNHPFVIWRMDADGICEGGDYRETLAEAAAAFEARR